MERLLQRRTASQTCFRTYRQWGEPHRDFAGTRLLIPPHQGWRRRLGGFINFFPDCFRAFNSAAARLLEFLFMGSERSNLPAPDWLPRSGIGFVLSLTLTVLCNRPLNRSMQCALNSPKSLMSIKWTAKLAPTGLPKQPALSSLTGHPRRASRSCLFATRYRRSN
jgi:hypothetical protein